MRLDSEILVEYSALVPGLVASSKFTLTPSEKDNRECNDRDSSSKWKRHQDNWKRSS